jgi:sec-independent protein translocase protein TatA
MGLDAPWHWVILLIAAVVLFGGYKKLPEVTRSVGRSLRIFKTELKGMTDDDAARKDSAGNDSAANDLARTEPQASVPPVPPIPPQVPPSLGADTPAAVPGNAAVSGAEPSQPAADAPRETPQQQG